MVLKAIRKRKIPFKCPQCGKKYFMSPSVLLRWRVILLVVSAAIVTEIIAGIVERLILNGYT